MAALTDVHAKLDQREYRLTRLDRQSAPAETKLFQVDHPHDELS